MILTPSSTSSAIAGVSFWALVWGTISHVDSVPVVKRIVNKEKIYRTVNENRTLTLIGTEVVNFSIHGISNPLAVTMAVGGSIVNSIVIFLLIPFRQKRHDKKMQRSVLQGV